jgi:hypothetical protein
MLGIIVLVLVNGLIDCTLVAYFSGKQSKKAIMGALEDPDDEVKQALANLVAETIPLVLGAQIPTGKMKADEDGKEHPETVDLITYAGRIIGNQILYKVKASRGGQIAQAGMDMTSEGGLDTSLLGTLGPRKGQSTVEWAMEQAVPRMMPMLEKKLDELLSKKNIY